MFNRRAWMLAAAAATAGHWSRDALALPPKQLQFPRDFTIQKKYGEFCIKPKFL